MRLLSLRPVWLEREGEQVGVMFRCPHCQKVWLTCFWKGMPIWGNETTPERGLWEGQMGYIRLALDKLKEQDFPENNVVPCEAMLAWNKTGDTFDTLSCSPSLNAEASGHWHGSIVNGEC